MSTLLTALERLEGRGLAADLPLPTSRAATVAERPVAQSFATPPATVSDALSSGAHSSSGVGIESYEGCDSAPVSNAATEVDLSLHASPAAATDAELAPSEPIVAPLPLWPWKATQVDEHAALVDALRLACPPPACVAFLACGVAGTIAPQVREIADAVAQRTGRDVVLLGPGVLDQVDETAGRWSMGAERAAYGFFHADAPFAVDRIDALRRVTAVVVVVELGRTTAAAVVHLRNSLAARQIALAGVVAVRNER